MHVPLGPLDIKSSQPDLRHKVLAWPGAYCLILPKKCTKTGKPKNGFLRQPSSRSKTFTTSLSQPQGCSESPQLALQPLWIDGKCKKWVLSPLGPRLHPCEHQRTPKRRAQGPSGAGPCRGDPKGPAWPPGATGVRVLARGAPRRGGCPCMTMHAPTFGGQVHNVNDRDSPPGLRGRLGHP